MNPTPLFLRPLWAALFLIPLWSVAAPPGAGTTETFLTIRWLRRELAQETKALVTMLESPTALPGIPTAQRFDRRAALKEDLQTIRTHPSFTASGLEERAQIYMRFFRAWRERLDLTQQAVLQGAGAMMGVREQLEYQEKILRDFVTWLRKSSSMRQDLKEELERELAANHDFGRVASPPVPGTAGMGSAYQEFVREETNRLRRFQVTIEDYVLCWTTGVRPQEVTSYRLRLNPQPNAKLASLRWPLLDRGLLEVKVRQASGGINGWGK